MSVKNPCRPIVSRYLQRPPCRSQPHALRHKLCVLFSQPFITRTTHNSSSPHHSIMDWIDIPQAPPAQERHNQCLGLNATTWSVDFHQRRWPTAQPPALGMAWYARSLTDAVSVTTMPHHGMAHQHTGSPPVLHTTKNSHTSHCRVRQRKRPTDKLPLIQELLIQLLIDCAVPWHRDRFLQRVYG